MLISKLYGRPAPTSDLRGQAGECRASTRSGSLAVADLMSSMGSATRQSGRSEDFLPVTQSESRSLVNLSAIVLCSVRDLAWRPAKCSRQDEFWSLVEPGFSAHSCASDFSRTAMRSHV